MIARRDIVMGAAALAAAGLTYQLKPHKRLSLLGDEKMAAIIPAAFGPWRAQNDDSQVRPETEGKLAARLYSEIVERIYSDAATGEAVMMLVAYGDTQSDLLQLHRPESCYPAVGFSLLSSRPDDLRVSPQVAIPGRRVVAEKGDRRENIFYWTRLGEFLPVSAGDQRGARLRAAMRGYIPDGGLFRFSVIGTDADRAFALLDRFIKAMIFAVPPGKCRGLLGSDMATRIAANRKQHAAGMEG
jgi:EpsI family protein